MALTASWKRAMQIGASSVTSSSSCSASESVLIRRFSRSISLDRIPSSSLLRCFSQLVKPNEKRTFLVDNLAMVRRLEAQGVPSKQADAITTAITQVLNDSVDNVGQSFISKSEMQKIELIQEANLSKFKSQVQSAQEQHFSSLLRETEKLHNDIEKMRSELRYEIDKVTAGQRLDLNLERGRIRDELATQSSETMNLSYKLDREIHAVRTQIEAAKYDVIKYCLGTLLSISAVGLATIRILM